MTQEDFSFIKQKRMLDELFADLLKRHSLNEIYKMDILETLRLINIEKIERKQKEQVDSLFAAFGK